MSNVQPGNLAMVVNAVAPWGGATCTVIRLAEMGPLPDDLLAKGPVFWWVEMARPMPCEGGESLDFAMPDVHLRKIGGPDVDVDAMEFNPLAHEQTA